MSDQVETPAGEGRDATIPCPNCGAGVPLAEAAGEAGGEVTCPRCGTRVPVEKTPTRGVSPS